MDKDDLFHFLMAEATARLEDAAGLAGNLQSGQLTQQSNVFVVGAFFDAQHKKVSVARTRTINCRFRIALFVQEIVHAACP